MRYCASRQHSKIVIHLISSLAIDTLANFVLFFNDLFEPLRDSTPAAFLFRMSTIGVIHHIIHTPFARSYSLSGSTKRFAQRPLLSRIDFIPSPPTNLSLTFSPFLFSFSVLLTHLPRFVEGLSKELACSSESSLFSRESEAFSSLGSLEFQSPCHGLTITSKLRSSLPEYLAAVGGSDSTVNEIWDLFIYAIARHGTFIDISSNFAGHFANRSYSIGKLLSSSYR